MTKEILIKLGFIEEEIPKELMPHPDMYTRKIGDANGGITISVLTDGTIWLEFRAWDESVESVGVGKYKTEENLKALIDILEIGIARD